jgi:hypothetical protein
MQVNELGIWSKIRLPLNDLILMLVLSEARVDEAVFH